MRDTRVHAPPRSHPDKCGTRPRTLLTELYPGVALLFFCPAAVAAAALRTPPAGAS